MRLQSQDRFDDGAPTNDEWCDATVAPSTAAVPALAVCVRVAAVDGRESAKLQPEKLQVPRHLQPSAMALDPSCEAAYAAVFSDTGAFCLN